MVKGSPKVSVLMPVFNGEKHLREAVESILHQTFADFEFLIIDDGSTDKSLDVIRSYPDERIRIVQNEKNCGLILTLNKGLDLAKGEYVARMDSDDISLPKRLERQVTYLDGTPEVGVCGTWIKFMGESRPAVVRYPVEHEEIRCRLLFANPLAHPSVMLRKVFFDKHNLRYENFKSAEDFELWQRCSVLFKLHNLPEVLLEYRVTSSSITHAKKDELADTVGVILKRGLDSLGIEADEKTVATQKNIGNESPLEKISDLRQIKRHIEELRTANDEKRAYSETVFDSVLAWYWRKICLKTVKRRILGVILKVFPVLNKFRKNG